MRMLKILRKQRNLSKLSLLQRREAKLLFSRNRFCSTSKMKILQDTLRNFVKNSSHQPAKNVPTEMLTEFVFVRLAGTMIISP